MVHPTVIASEQIAQVIAQIDSLDFDTKIKTLESIGKRQPAVTGAVVQMTRMGVDYPTAEHAFHILLVLHECFVRDVPDNRLASTNESIMALQTLTTSSNRSSMAALFRIASSNMSRLISSMDEHARRRELRACGCDRTRSASSATGRGRSAPRKFP